MFDLAGVDDWNELAFQVSRAEDLRSIELFELDEWLERQERYND